MNFHTSSYQLELTQAKDTSKDDLRFVVDVSLFSPRPHFILIEQVNWHL